MSGTAPSGPGAAVHFAIARHPLARDRATGPSFDTVLVVDFGAQYAQLIARRVREAHVYSEIVPHTMPAAEMMARRPAAVIFSGGPKSVHVEGAPSVDPTLYDTGVPVLGICYGAQLLAQQLGGEVGRTGRGEYGRTAMTVVDGSALFADLPLEQDVWMSHFDSIAVPPAGFRVVATTPDAVAAIEDPDRRLFGVQFHPEVVHTTRGQEVLKHFLYEVAGCRPSWTMTSVIEQQVSDIRAQVGDEKVICGLSGGVDSAVAAAIVHKAVGDNLTCVFVDTGLMRAGEAEQVEDTFRRQFGVDLVHVKAADRFVEALNDVIDPERKRKIIGETFIRVFEEVAKDLQDARFLVQGTLYPDIIESGTKDAARIKSHHNVGGLPDDMNFELVEPLRNLFKDEVRAVGEELGLPEEIVWRQPFPGPGLAVRIVGTVTPERLEILRAADAIVLQEMRRAGLERQVWQSFAVLLAVRTVGVMGDERTYAHPVVIRAVTSDDAMTADWARIPYDVLERMSSRIINEVPGVNRVAFDITSKPPGTIEWE
ncbi:MAG TPA: glutamine-hydrolyzing GMP synthase [Acidimicrobiales bacterium]|jgi:GMP synthase (glutamine-hydrolysing)|nr:glutamine-hydrolyzing GMP synthase [Acidimicrobiales bacterium]